MNTLELAKVAKSYYSRLCAKSVFHGWEKYVVTNGSECMFVHSDYEPGEGEVVFFLCLRNGNVMCELKKTGKEK